MKISARFFLTSVIFAIFYLLFSIVPAFAQSQNPNPYTVPNTNPDVPKNLHTWTQNVMIEVMSAMSCQLTGIDPTNPKAQCLGVDQKTGKIGYVEGGGGAIGVAGKMIAMLYTPPLHTGDYFKYLASNFGIAKPTHAATGFEGLKPIQSLWVAFRNIVYLLFVIIFIVIGLAIMLRVRIDPRTIMTIQNQIPKIIIGILLVTFSFAIAGFLIDLMYVVIFLSYELISQAVPSIGSSLNPLFLQDATPFKAASEVGGIWGIAWSAGDAIKDIILELFDVDNTFSIANIVLITISSLAGAAIGALTFPFGLILGPLSAIAINEALQNLPALIAALIIFIALLIALIKLWFALIMAYISILLNVVFAPFWIAAALLPGSSIGFGAWLRSIIANLAAFPATIIMFLLAKAFIDSFGAKPAPTDFVPPLIGNFAGTDSIGKIIGLGIILMTPNVVAMLKAALKAPTTPLGAIGTAIGAGTGTLTSPFKIGGHVVTSAVGYKLAQRIPLPKFLGGKESQT